MIEYKNGFARIEGQLLFSVSAEDIVWRMRDDWLGDIEAGHNRMFETVIPYLEREAISRFAKEWTVQREVPKIQDGYEDWRLWWMNEASQNCSTHDPIGRAGSHLSPIGQSAVNILMAASALRDAIDGNKGQEAAALGMLLICEAIAGGESLKGESAKVANEAAREAKTQAYEAGAGKGSQDMAKARSGAVAFAKKTWPQNPEMRIGKMADEILALIKKNKDKLPTLVTFPKPATIKTWLRDAARDGQLVIPPAAQRPGLPKSSK